MFYGMVVTALREKAKSKRMDDPTALTGFISDRAIAASRVISASPKPTIINQIVNIRRLTKPYLPDNSAGIIFLEATVAPLDRHESTTIMGTQLSGLVASLREALKKTTVTTT